MIGKSETSYCRWNFAKMQAVRLSLPLFFSDTGPPLIFRHPWSQRFSRISILPNQQRSRPPRAIKWNRNGPPRLPGSRDTDPHIWLWEWICWLRPRGKFDPLIGCGSPDEVAIGRLTRARHLIYEGTSRGDFKCALMILSGLMEVSDHQLPESQWGTCIWWISAINWFILNLFSPKVHTVNPNSNIIVPNILGGRSLLTYWL